MTGDLRSTGGRRPGLLALNGDAGYFVAVDVSASRIRFGVVDLVGEIRYCLEKEFPFGQKLEISELIDGIQRTLESLSSRDRARTLSIGISVPGILEDRAMVTSVNLRWHRVPLLAKLRETIDLPLTVEEDSRIGVFAEHWLGAARNTRNCLYVVAGNGIGLGCIVDGRLVEGQAGLAGEFGHINTDPKSADQCYCGKKGCLETVCSNPNIVRQYLERLSGMVPVRPVIRAAQVFERARQGDTNAVAVVHRAASCLGWAVSHLVNVLNPEIIVVGGDVANVAAFLPQIQAEIDRHCIPQLRCNLKVVPSALGFHIGLKGAALAAFRMALKDPVLLRKLGG
jgi:glucokinase